MGKTISNEPNDYSLFGNSGEKSHQSSIFVTWEAMQELIKELITSKKEVKSLHCSQKAKKKKKWLNHDVWLVRVFKDFLKNQFGHLS